MNTQNNILSQLDRAIPDGNASMDYWERIAREITFKEVSANCNNEKIRIAIKELCEKLRFSVRIKPRQIDKASFPTREVIGCFGCGIIYCVSYLLSESHLVSVILCVVAGLVYGKYISKGENISRENPEMDMKDIRSMHEKLAKEIEQAICSFNNIISFLDSDKLNPGDLLENGYYTILRFLYDDYIGCLAEGGSDKFRMTSIRLIFDQYGYELIQYAKDKEFCFNSSLATTVSECTTSIPALLNKQTGACVFKGHVLFPKLNS